MDIGGGIRRMERGQVDMSDGHLVKEDASIPRTTQKQTFYIDRTFDFNCPKMSTSWYFRITFTRKPWDYLSCLTSIRRTDKGTALVDVQFGATIRLEHLQCDDVCVKHMVSGMAPDQVDIKVLGTVIEGVEARILEYRQLPFELFFTVQGCHSQVDLTGSCLKRVKTSNDDSECLPASKRICLKSCL